MKDFKNFTGNTPENNQNGSISSGAGDFDNSVELAKIVTRAMNGKNQMQIMRTIISEAERGKREGRLTNADLDNFYAALAPTLDGIKRKKLAEIITRLKNI